jgi:hypothetical protein
MDGAASAELTTPAPAILGVRLGCSTRCRSGNGRANACHAPVLRKGIPGDRSGLLRALFLLKAQALSSMAASVGPSADV